jgi:plastocyanin
MRKILALVIGLAVILSLAGVALAATRTVRARGERWKPVHTYIGKGDKVRWTNPTSKTHDIKGSGGLRISEVLSPGESVSKKFGRLGTFRFRCVRHSAMVSGKCQGMCGLVHVVA